MTGFVADAPVRTVSSPRLRPGLTVLSTLSGSGKSLLTRTLAVLRRRRGSPVAVYKPVAVTLKPVPTPAGEVDLSLALTALAAGAADPREVCDFAFAGGRLRRLSDAASWPAELLSEDGLAYPTLPPEAVGAVLQAVRDRVSTGRFLICEGAGSATDLPPEWDLSNTALAERAGRPVVFVASARQGGALACLAGTQRVLPPAVRGMVAGFVLNNAAQPDRAHRLAVRMSEETGWPCLGVVPRIPLYAHLPDRGAATGTADGWAQELDTVADFVDGHLAPSLKRLLDRAEGASGPGIEDR